MTKKKVLVVGMLDSIHIARWIKQFVGTELDILVFPSSHFKFTHPNLLELKNSNIRIRGAAFSKSFLGYFDSLITFRFFGNRFGKFMRRFYLLLVVAIYRPGVIHAIEIQHAGYLVSSIKGISNRRILTNWGSDIYYFQHVAGHRIKISKALDWATHYSAECMRD
jgi:Glycosyl transferase 4-like